MLDDRDHRRPREGPGQRAGRTGQKRGAGLGVRAARRAVGMPYHAGATGVPGVRGGVRGTGTVGTGRVRRRRSLDAQRAERTGQERGVGHGVQEAARGGGLDGVRRGATVSDDSGVRGTGTIGIGRVR